MNVNKLYTSVNSGSDVTDGLEKIFGPWARTIFLAHFSEILARLTMVRPYPTDSKKIWGLRLGNCFSLFFSGSAEHGSAKLIQIEPELIPN